MQNSDGYFTYMSEEDQQAANVALAGVEQMGTSTVTWAKQHWALVALMGAAIVLLGWKAYGIKRTYDRGKRKR